jgi:indole-3-glycerol phosphate synthase
MADTPDILKKIVAQKWREVERDQQSLSLADITLRANELESETRGFVDRIRQQHESGSPAVIAELKKASPSKGVIREHFIPEAIARSYAEAGATCLSVLTDEAFFQGSNLFLQQAREACQLPVLRKDFTVDSYQVYEAKLIGADCILLIVAILELDELQSLASLAGSLGLDVLIEVHDEQELALALSLEPKLIGINNRDLRTFTVSLDTTLSLLEKIPAHILVISESGISAKEQVEQLGEAGVAGFLVGESLMREENPGIKLKSLFG